MKRTNVHNLKEMNNERNNITITENTQSISSATGYKI